ncbi:MAG: CsbD family protein [Gammaproteobacteria bacterium]|jgi:uncharacterized protein YjbJ (UPF0337 family)|nr:CsbD family protein [Gammaproteobacteria bacterium]
MNKNQISGRIDEVKGKSKQAVGKIVGNKKLEREGRIEKISGQVEKNIGDIKRDVNNA